MTGTSRHLIDGLSQHAIFKLDVEGKITTWPEPARSLYGYEPSDVLGQQLTVLLAGDMETDIPLMELCGGDAESSHEMTSRHCRADSSEFWATMTLTPLRNDDLHGYAVVSRDTTAERQ